MRISPVDSIMRLNTNLAPVRRDQWLIC